MINEQQRQGCHSEQVKDTEKQHWFHHYPGQGVTSKNPLHWSKPSQNANFMCVECHTTGYKRNFDAAKNTFDSRWNSLGVGCQACHGPASNYLEWTAKKTDLIHAGFAVDLKDKSATVEIETCARCHSRRAPLNDGLNGRQTANGRLPAERPDPRVVHAGRQDEGRSVRIRLLCPEQNVRQGRALQQLPQPAQYRVEGTRQRRLPAMPQHRGQNHRRRHRRQGPASEKLRFQRTHSPHHGPTGFAVRGLPHARQVLHGQRLAA